MHSTKAPVQITNDQTITNLKEALDQLAKVKIPKFFISPDENPGVEYSQFCENPEKLIQDFLNNPEAEIKRCKTQLEMYRKEIRDLVDGCQNQWVLGCMGSEEYDKFYVASLEKRMSIIENTVREMEPLIDKIAEQYVTVVSHGTNPEIPRGVCKVIAGYCGLFAKQDLAEAPSIQDGAVLKLS